MYIGKLAKRTGASPKAIRHYEALGLLKQVSRAGDYRVYSEEDVETVAFIREAQRLGFKLAELVRLRGLSEEFDWSAIIALIDTKHQALTDEIVRLQALQTQLANLSAQLKSCPISQQIAGPAKDADCLRQISEAYS